MNGQILNIGNCQTNDCIQQKQLCYYLQNNQTMTTYGQGYYLLLQKMNEKYLGLSNLNNLRHLENKIKCYKQFSLKPHEYYECFLKVEQSRENDSKQLVTNYQLHEEELKLCNEGCSKIASAESSLCVSKCTERFGVTVGKLYDAFYKSRLDKHKEYKKAMKDSK